MNKFAMLGIESVETVFKLPITLNHYPLGTVLPLSLQVLKFLCLEVEVLG